MTEWACERPRRLLSVSKARERGGLQPQGTEFKGLEEEVQTQLAPEDHRPCVYWVGMPHHLLRLLPSPPAPGPAHLQ